VPDEDAEAFWGDLGGKKRGRILRRVLRAMERNTKEREGFKPLDLEG
jgi:hypothetical protein